ncbi:hypothetical protein HPB51_018223 [Rhipicephalus microplus]|uniref:Uncharacterized protein n=1 Tax=Rhipicephalus microplus TaxID=6941 RepID=A0A9J6E3P5_RHIMP|nr:hypothetical protein HPB51_018223 [Rhipicephalus microplus]
MDNLNQHIKERNNYKTLVKQLQGDVHQKMLTLENAIDKTKILNEINTIQGLIKERTNYIAMRQKVDQWNTFDLSRHYKTMDMIQKANAKILSDTDKLLKESDEITSLVTPQELQLMREAINNIPEVAYEEIDLEQITFNEEFESHIDDIKIRLKNRFNRQEYLLGLSREYELFVETLVIPFISIHKHYINVGDGVYDYFKYIKMLEYTVDLYFKTLVKLQAAICKYPTSYQLRKCQEIINFKRLVTFNRILVDKNEPKKNLDASLTEKVERYELLLKDYTECIIEQAQFIKMEMNSALSGNHDRFRSLLSELQEEADSINIELARGKQKSSPETTRRRKRRRVARTNR